MREIIREMFREMPIAIITLLVLICLIVFILIDGLASYPESFNGVVLDKHYKSETNSTGTGYGTTSNGKGGVIVTSHHESEKFLLMVKVEGGEVVTVQCEPEIYYKKELGNEIQCNAYKGFFTGLTWSLYGVK